MTCDNAACRAFGTCVYDDPPCIIDTDDDQVGARLVGLVIIAAVLSLPLYLWAALT